MPPVRAPGSSPSTYSFNRWTPPKDHGLTGAFRKNELLTNLERLDVTRYGNGPEDLAVDAQGNVYAGLEQGTIVRFRPGSKEPELFARGLGRPLGMEFGPDGALYVCDAKKGLVRVKPDGTSEVLLEAVAGRKLTFPNNLDVTKDGVVYFTDSSIEHPQTDYLGEVIAHDDGGRLLSFDTRTGKAGVVKDGLAFPNGVALSRDEDFLVVCEMNSYRLLRVWLQGDKQGEVEPFVENLPGFPDNVSSDDQGRFWVGISGLRTAMRDKTLPHPWARELLSMLPRAAIPRPPAHGFVVAFDEQGAVAGNLQDPDGEFSDTTSAVAHNGDLYVGSLHEGAIGVVRGAAGPASGRPGVDRLDATPQPPRKVDLVNAAKDWAADRVFEAGRPPVPPERLEGPFKVAYGPLAAPPRLERPVVMFPGLTMPASSFDRLAQQLASEPANGPVAVYVAEEDTFRLGSVRGRELTAEEVRTARIFEVEYRDPWASPTQKAPQIAQALSRVSALTGSAGLDVVAHSAAGTDFRLYLDRRAPGEGPAIEHAVLVGPASRGTYLGNIGKVVGDPFKNVDEAAGELAVGAELVEQLHERWARQRDQVRGGVTLVGTTGTPTLGPAPGLTEDGDGFMPTAQLALPGAKLVLMEGPHKTPLAHLWQIQYSGVVNATMDALR